jgi:hypothetical protein
VHNHRDEVPRPVRPTDALVIVTELLFNVSQVVATFFESLMELSIYHSNRQTKITKVWDNFAQDLETIQEDTDGA